MSAKKTTAPGGFLGTVERVGNKLPDPAVLFIALLFIVWVLSWLLSYVSFDVVDPRTNAPLVINNLLSGSAFTEFLSVMVTNFSHFHPVGVVLVAMLGIGVAEHTGFINSAIRSLLNVTPAKLLTPMVILVGIVSHSAVDAGYVLVIPLGGVIFYAAGRHPLAGIAAAFAGVSGGFSANFVPSSLDPLLQGLTQAGAQILDPSVIVNPAQQLLLYDGLIAADRRPGLVHHRQDRRAAPHGQPRSTATPRTCRKCMISRTTSAGACDGRWSPWYSASCCCS